MGIQVNNEQDRETFHVSIGDHGAIDRAQPLLAKSGRGQDAISPQATGAKGVAQIFGLDIRAAILTVLVDLMVFGGDAASLGMLIPMGIVVAAILAFIVYKIQTHWYGDDHNSALIKAMIVGLLTAIPAPVAPLFAIPGGLAGIAKAIRRK